MAVFDQELFNSFPGAAVLIQGNVVAAANPMARQYLPQLEPGSLVSAPIFGAGGEREQAGTLTLNGSAYSVRRTEVEGGSLLLFTPAPQAVLTDGQLDSALRHMRTLLSELLANEEGTQDKAVFLKTFHRLFRLTDNLDFLRALDLAPESVFRPTPMDLAAVCRRLADRVVPLLAEAGVELRFQCTRQSMLISGDPLLLQRLMLELLSNAVRQTAGKLTLRLRPAPGRAVLSLSAGDVPPTDEQLAVLLQQEPASHIPEPGTGAGLGLTIARRIAVLHGGSLLVEWGEGKSPAVVLVLPTGPLGSYLPVEDPGIRRDGGLDRVMTALSDVLPARLFRPESR